MMILFFTQLKIDNLGATEGIFKSPDTLSRQSVYRRLLYMKLLNDTLLFRNERCLYF